VPWVCLSRVRLRDRGVKVTTWPKTAVLARAGDCRGGRAWGLTRSKRSDLVNGMGMVAMNTSPSASTAISGIIHHAVGGRRLW